jgi:hypothetical protein
MNFYKSAAQAVKKSQYEWDSDVSSESSAHSDTSLRELDKMCSKILKPGAEIKSS